MSDKLERIVKFRPAFDKRDPDPKKNYGIHGVELLMALKGDEGAVQFLLFTNWQLPHVTEEEKHRADHILCQPIPADLGYHSKVPRWKDQRSISDADNPCEFTGGVCYYDGSGLNAERIYQVLLTEGSDGVWRELEDYYHSTFGKDNNGD